MSIEVDDYDFVPLEILSWARENSLWEGRVVSLGEVEDLQEEILVRIFKQLESLPVDSQKFADLSAFFALAGSVQRDLATRDIQELVFSHHNLIQQAGLCKSISKFWKKHKKEIIIGAVVVAVVVTVVVVSVSTAGVASGAAASAGAAAVSAIQAQEEEPSDSPPEIKNHDDEPSRTSKSSSTLLEPAESTPTLFNEELCLPDQSWYERQLASEGVHEKVYSNQIHGINGIMTSEMEAQSHAEYLQKLAGDVPVDWTYDRSSGLVGDLAGVFLRDYLGVSSQGSKTLEEKWSAFHEANLENPDAKLLHFCHSRGAIKTRNSLAHCPKEVCDRVVVVAIAPAAIIPRSACYEVYNYASKKDVVHYGELILPGFFNSSEIGNSKYIEMILENRKNLILLDPHPDATGIDHDFQSPTFYEVIKERIDEYHLFYREGSK